MIKEFPFKGNEAYYVAAVIILLIVVIQFFRRINAEHRQMLEIQAMKLGGHVSGRFLLPQLSFRYGEINVKVVMTLGNKKRPPQTHVFCEFSHDPALSFHLWAKGSQVGQPLSPYKKVNSAQKDFDEAFTLWASDEKIFQAVFTKDLTDKFIHIKDFSPSCSLTGRNFRLRAEGKVNSDDDLGRIVQAAIGVIEKFTTR